MWWFHNRWCHAASWVQILHSIASLCNCIQISHLTTSLMEHYFNIKCTCSNFWNFSCWKLYTPFVYYIQYNYLSFWNSLLYVFLGWGYVCQLIFLYDLSQGLSHLCHCVQHPWKLTIRDFWSCRNMKKPLSHQKYVLRTCSGVSQKI